MAPHYVFVITTVLSLWISPIIALSPPTFFLPPSPSPSPAPAPAPSPPFVNLTYMLSLTNSYKTFLNLLLQTDVIQTFQNQANNTKEGITIFVPSNSAFTNIEKPSLSDLTMEQLKSLLLYHAFPKFYSLSELKNLNKQNPVSTFAGGQYTLNITDNAGIIRVGSDWTNPEIKSSVYSTYPVAMYELNNVLLPKAIVTTPPTITPTPASAPNLTDLLSLTDSYKTFLNLLLQTDVIQTFQNQANNTKEGITIFVPSNSAFTNIEKPSLSDLTKEQLKSLLLYHAFPKFYSLSELKNLNKQNPVSTFAGGQYTLNITDNAGIIRVGSDWTNPEIKSSVYSTYPVAMYELNNVLLPKAIVTTPPTITPTPAPAPNLTDLLSLTDSYKTFLNLLLQTDVIQTFQNQANNTKEGITIFVPSNSAFTNIEKPSLSDLTKEQLKSLLLYHAFPKFYSLSELKNLNKQNPVSTFAGGQYTLNITDNAGIIRVGSDWTNPEIKSSVYSTYPVAVYELNAVLLPKAIVTTPPTITPTLAPAPNLTYLLSLTDSYKTFLNLLLQTDVIQTFQNQANNTKEGITIFVPSNSAFTNIEKPSLSDLTKEQLKSLLLYHAFPKFYPLSEFKNLSKQNPVSTFAGGQYTLNLTDNAGIIRVGSDWTNPEIKSSVYSTYPVAVYELNSVLLPKAIVTTPPTITPTPAPAPNLTDLLSLTDSYKTFLNLLLQTDVIQTFQNQANNTKEGITIFVPSNSAFANIEKPSLSDLTKEQLKSLLLYHALPKFYPLSEFKNLSKQNPVSTFAGGQYTLNLTDNAGIIQVGSDWTNPQIKSSVYNTYPVAVYELNNVLLPKAIVTTPPTFTSAPAPAPEPSESANTPSSSHVTLSGSLSSFLALAWGTLALVV